MKIKRKTYEDLGTCIRSDQLPAHTVAEYFMDEKFLKWYKKRYDIGERPKETSHKEWLKGFWKWKNEQQ
jgi:hypothetical protein